LKATDLKLCLLLECQVWYSSNHEPLGFFVYLPLCRHEPWRMWYTVTVLELESALRSFPSDDLLQKGCLLCNFLANAKLGCHARKRGVRVVTMSRRGAGSL
jgi:hypothetical protein